MYFYAFFCQIIPSLQPSSKPAVSSPASPAKESLHQTSAAAEPSLHLDEESKRICILFFVSPPNQKGELCLHQWRPRPTSTFCLGSVPQLGKPGKSRKVSFYSRLHCSREAAAPCKKTNEKCLQEIIHSSQALWQHILHRFCFFNSWSCAQIGCEVNKPTSLFFAGSLQQQEKRKEKAGTWTKSAGFSGTEGLLFYHRRETDENVTLNE